MELFGGWDGIVTDDLRSERETGLDGTFVVLLVTLDEPFYFKYLHDPVVLASSLISRISSPARCAPRNCNRRVCLGARAYAFSATRYGPTCESSDVVYMPPEYSQPDSYSYHAAAYQCMIRDLDSPKGESIA